MYETYQDHPKQAKGSIRVVLAVAFLACAIGAGIFLITRLASKPLAKEDARAQTGIVYDSSAVEGGWDNLSPEEIAEKLNEKVAEGMINISIQKPRSSAVPLCKLQTWQARSQQQIIRLRLLLRDPVWQEIRLCHTAAHRQFPHKTV